MADEATTENGTPGNDANGEFDFAAWLGEQPDTVKQAIESSTASLHNALKAEREERKALARQLREATAQAETGSDLRRQLEELSSKHEQAERKAAFLEDAIKPEIGCSNPRAAFLVATAEGLFDRRGDPDWKAIKAAAPELFQRKLPTGNAGAGQNSPPARASSMNDLIRQAAGRG